MDGIEWGMVGGQGAGGPAHGMWAHPAAQLTHARRGADETRFVEARSLSRQVAELQTSGGVLLVVSGCVSEPVTGRRAAEGADAHFLSQLPRGRNARRTRNYNTR